MANPGMLIRDDLKLAGYHRIHFGVGVEVFGCSPWPVNLLLIGADLKGI